MSGLQERVDDHLRLRRALGFKLERHGRLLPQLVTHLEAAGASTVTSELAISWARLPAGAQPRHWAARLAVARGFAAHLRTIDPTTEVPPAEVFAVRYRRPTPYPWSRQDIRRLLDAARMLRPPLRAASHEALFGLLAVSGMRVGEAVALEVDDLDLDEGVITIRERVAKHERARLVPLHATTVEALARRARARQRLCPKPGSRALFLSGTGGAHTWTGRRDHAMFALAIQTGLRISELISLDCRDVTLGTGANVHTVGKGRKERRTPLIPVTRAILKVGSTNAQAPPSTRCSRPTPAGASAATRSNADSRSG